jgi:hypothetical protein
MFTFLLFVTFFYGQKSVPQDEIKAKIEIEKMEGHYCARCSRTRLGLPKCHLSIVGYKKNTK